MRPVVTLPPPVMYSMTVGGCLDIPTGEYLVGTHDQRVFLGGISNITGVVGPGNCFKTTLMRFMILSALSRMYRVAADELYYLPYDTELNVHEHRVLNLSWSFEAFRGRNLIEEGLIAPTNKAIYQGNEIWQKIRTDLKDKIDNKKKRMYDTAFLSRDKVSPMKIMVPWFTDIDSLSQFMTADVEAMMDKNELGDSGGNTIFMRQGLAKMRMLMEMPTVAAQGQNYFLFTGHIGKAMNMATAPGQAPARKQLGGMRQDEVIKGVTNNFFYLLHNCWLVDLASPAINQSTKAPEYPYEPGDEVAGDMDLMRIRIKQLRGKNGSSNYALEIYVSQREGVLPYLTEFVYIKEGGRYGLEGNDRNYSLSLMPEVNLSRTTVRQKLRESPKLQRAVEITSQLLQLEIFHPLLKDQLLKPAELYTALKDKGYDWDWLLQHTRSWHTIDDEIHPGYPLSTLDLCRVARGDYHPYWLESDCKTVKPEYAAKKIGDLHDFAK